MNEPVLISTAVNKKDRRILSVAAFILLVGLAAYAPQAVKKSHRSDFQRYYVAGFTALHGGDIYQFVDRREFKYFPFFAQVMLPLAAVSEWWTHGTIHTPAPSEESLRTGAYLWYILLCLSYWGSVFFAVKLCRPETLRQGLIIGAFAAALSLRFFIANIRNGQINMPVMFLAVWGIYLVTNNRERLGAICIALGVAIKFMPFVLYLWFLRRRKKSSFALEQNFATQTKNPCRCVPLLWGLSTLLAVLFLVPTLTWPGGISGAARQLQRYYNLRKQMVTSLPTRSAAGQSLPSLTNRLFQKVNAAPLRKRKINGKKTNAPIYINVTTLSSTATKNLVLVVILTATLLAYFLLGRGGDAADNTPTRTALRVGLLFLLMLMISPEARKAHYVTLLVPGAALVAYALRRREQGDGQPRGRWGLWVVGAAIFWIVGTSREVFGENSLYYLLRAYGSLLMVVLFLFICSIFALRQERRVAKP